MLQSTPLPNRGYQLALDGIHALEKQAGGPFCREETCLEAGTERSQRGYPACKKHVKDIKSPDTQETVHEEVREIHLKPGMQVTVVTKKVSNG